MSLQVNLLKKSERRFQGIVSMKVMALGSAGLLAGITALVFLLAGISKMTLNSNLDRARRELERIEPQAEFLRKARASTVANRKTLTELEGWAQGDHLSMFGILRAVQSRIPAQMTLENFFSGIEQADEKEPVYYTLRLSGRSQGELTAVEAKRQLNADAEVRGFCGEVRLVSSQREAGDVWIFALEGRRSVEGGGK